MSETPTASLSGRPNPIVRSGTIRIPPPSPRSEPNTPAATPPASIRTPIATSGVGGTLLGAQVLRRVRQERDVSRPLQRHRQLALVAGAGTGLAARLDLRPLGKVAAKAVHFLVVNLNGLVGAERADLPATPVAVVVVALLRTCGGHRIAFSSGAAGSGRRPCRCSMAARAPRSVVARRAGRRDRCRRRHRRRRAAEQSRSGS